MGRDAADPGTNRTGHGWLYEMAEFGVHKTGSKPDSTNQSVDAASAVFRYRSRREIVLTRLSTIKGVQL
jgi:hypothetical protein